jgi:imidazolonepropionase-like amidohydrolase
VSRTLYRDAALADGRSAEIRVGVSILVDSGTIAWIRPSDAELDPGPADGLEIVDASGATIVPGMVDGHSHLTLPGGAHWIDRGFDETKTLLDVAEHNGRLMSSAGVRWARDAGSPTRVDPHDGSERALAIGVRDRWRGRAGFP